MVRARKGKLKEVKDGRSSLEESELERELPVPKKIKKESLLCKSSLHDAIHRFTETEAKDFSSSLLKWYHCNKRELPWRSLPKDLSFTDRAYAVLVSEVMLQQTQVVTVLPYYKKWMSRWPTFRHLSQASLNEVNEVWSGMGYYSRAKRLWEAAKKVADELQNQAPQTSVELQEKLPGVGRYTAGAVASIAFGERSAAVDGNVVRVLSRVRCIGADANSKVVLDHIWSLSDILVPSSEPGNYNQAMMDLGATICTPKKPSCKTCPVAHLCSAVKYVEQKNPLKELQVESSKLPINDIENVPCHLCLKQPWNHELGVMNFPFKAKKAPPRKEVTLVCVTYVSSPNGNNEYLVVQRPQGGLLAGLWEFPNMLFTGDRIDGMEEERKAIKNELLLQQWGVKLNQGGLCFVGEVPHIFSHIHQMYVIYCLKIAQKSDASFPKKRETRWMNADEVVSSAISTAMKKVFKAYLTFDKKKPSPSTKKQPGLKKSKPDISSRKVSDFFKKVEK